MAAKYLKSLITGVVLPYNEAALKSADIRLLDPAECEEYEIAQGISTKAAPVEETPPAPEPVFEEVVLTPPPQPEPEPVAEDEAEDEPDVDEVIAALEVS